MMHHDASPSSNDRIVRGLTEALADLLIAIARQRRQQAGQSKPTTSQSSNTGVVK